MRVQVAIIGGGPAGATCAAALAQRGISVLVIESRAFPRAKVCGEFISPAASEILEQYLPAAAMRVLGACRIDRFQMYAHDKQVADWPLPENAWSLSRAALDRALLHRAQQLGAQVLQPACVRGVTYRPDEVHLHLDGVEIYAQVVVHADGRGRFDPAGAVLCRPNVVGMKCHLDLARPLGSVLRFYSTAVEQGNAYFGLVSVEHQQATLAMVVDQTLVHFHEGDLDAVAAQFWPEFATHTRSSDWMTCGVPSSGYICPGHARSIRIGNAAAAVEPVGGEGIGLAIWSGDLAGRLLDPAAPRGAQVALRKAYRRRLRLRRPGAKVLAHLLRHPRLLQWLTPLVRAHPGWALRPLYHLTGKPLWHEPQAGTM